MGQCQVARDLAALADAKNDRGNQQLLRISMDTRIESKARGDDACPDVRAVLDVEAAIGAKAPCLSGPDEVEMSKAPRRKRIADNRVDQPQVQLAGRLGLPAGMGKVFKDAGNFQSPVLDAVAACGHAQRAQGCRSARQLQRGLEKSLYLRRRRFARIGATAAREV